MIPNQTKTITIIVPMNQRIAFSGSIMSLSKCGLHSPAPEHRGKRLPSELAVLGRLLSRFLGLIVPREDQRCDVFPLAQKLLQLGAVADLVDKTEVHLELSLGVRFDGHFGNDCERGQLEDVRN